MPPPAWLIAELVDLAGIAPTGRRSVLATSAGLRRRADVLPECHGGWAIALITTTASLAQHEPASHHHRDFNGGGGSQNHIRSVPFPPTAQQSKGRPQLSLPGAGAVSFPET
jgi:hypothetical protein